MTKEHLKQLENDLWAAADTLRANSDLKASEYSTPVLGLIFLKFADNKYRKHEPEILKEYDTLKGTRREKPLSDIALEKCGFYLPDHARYDYLLTLPEQENIAKAITEAMKAIEEHKTELQGVLPQDEYARLTRTDASIPGKLLKTFADIPPNASGDMFGQIYEYFLGEFAKSEGQKGGEFFTPRSVVHLMVEIIEPYRGTVFDPACGSGGMFVQSAQFIERHRSDIASQNGKNSQKTPDGDIYVCGQEKTLETVKLAKMNLAVNGLRGEVRQANSYYEDPYTSFDKFDYVMANPPFNVDDVSVSSVEKDPRFNAFGIPRNKSKAKKGDQGKETVPNANYLWINLFAASLKPKGRAALVMANSASDARHSEAKIRRTLIEKNFIYGMLTLPSNMFYTVTLPATLWFFDKAKADNRILFIDARNIFTQIDRAHRAFSDQQVQNIAIISHLRRGKRNRFVQLIDSYFTQGMERLLETHAQVETVSEQLLEVLDDANGKQAVAELVTQWAELTQLQARYATYRHQHADQTYVSKKNHAQHRLRETFDPFFVALHAGLKRLDAIVRQHEKQRAHTNGKRGGVDRQPRALNDALEALHAELKTAERFFVHIRWLQERFPKAEYEDVTGLCKLATLEEVEEQDYSLNPGRYVGVVIEEDGKTEEEFIEDILSLNAELLELNKQTGTLESIIAHNVKQLTGE